MKNLRIQLFIILIGLLLSYAGYSGVKKYFYNTYKKEVSYTMSSNSYLNMKYIRYILESKEIPNVKVSIVEDKTKEIIKKDINTEENKIIYEGLTKKELVEKLNKNLNSTLSNTGNYFVDYYIKTGLDPYLAVSIVLHETGCKWNCSGLVTDCYNIGGMRGGEKQCGSTGYRAYDSLEEGINGYLDMLYNNYYKEGLTTPELINPKYAASTTWSTKINNYINEIRAS